jgi:hypothetical protein
MSPAEVVAGLLAAGADLRVTPEGKVRVANRSVVPVDLLAAARAVGPEFVQEVTTRWCTGCDSLHPRTVSAHWNRTERYCPSCCLAIQDRYLATGHFLPPKAESA